MDKDKDMKDVLITLEQGDMDEGAVYVSSDFQNMNSLSQADLLQGWIEDLEDMYQSVISGNFLQDMAPARFNKRLN